MSLPWDKEESHEAIDANKLFFLSYEEPMKDENGVKREILPNLGLKWPIIYSSISLVRGD
jgi:hypothetical protein